MERRSSRPGVREDPELSQAKALYRSRHASGARGWVARILSFIYLRIRPPAPRRPHDALSELLAAARPGERVLLLGSNLPPARLDRFQGLNVTQLDIQDHEHTDVVADAETMSKAIEPSSFDYVVSTSMLEHTSHPWRVFDETFIVLREGGVVFAEVPWTYPLHGEPYDFFRFSVHGLTSLAEDSGFEVLDAGSSVSPQGALFAFMRGYLSEALSFDRDVLYYGFEFVFSWLLYPLRLLERFAPLGRHRRAFHTDCLVYVVGKKPGPEPRAAV